MKTIAEGWAEYRRLVIPPSAPPIQLQECRRTYYAAVEWMLLQFWHGGEDAVSEDAGVEYMESLSVEARAFAQLVAERKA